VVVHAPQVIAAGHGRERAIERENLEAVAGRSRSRMISGRKSETTYEQTENLNPGKISSVQAAPPRMWRRSSTRTFFQRARGRLR